MIGHVLRVHRLDIAQIQQPIGIRTRGQILDRVGTGAAGVAIANIGGEEFDVSPRRVLIESEERGEGSARSGDGPSSAVWSAHHDG
jgi:hypothetical protein